MRLLLSQCCWNNFSAWTTTTSLLALLLLLDAAKQDDVRNDDENVVAFVRENAENNSDILWSSHGLRAVVGRAILEFFVLPMNGDGEKPSTG